MITEESTGLEPLTDLQLTARVEDIIAKCDGDLPTLKEVTRRWLNTQTDLEMSEQGRQALLAQIDKMQPKEPTKHA
jgi:hypothetical protein